MEPSTAAIARDAYRGQTRATSRARRFEIPLLVLFLLSLPFSNPWVHGDGVGYYAFARALLIQHNLDFRQDWLDANLQFRLAHTDADGNLSEGDFTSTGHILNHFSIGPAILWAPFLIVAHASVLLADALGAHVAANGFSRPYVVAMALATAIYGFLAIWISFQIACRYVEARWAFLAAIGIWFASSLPVYMYFNPSWSHAQSAFVVALFVWYWDRTRGSRTRMQWVALGAIGGLMMDVYYVSALLLLLPLMESAAQYRKTLTAGGVRECAGLFANDALLACAAFLVFMPTLITKKIIFGSYLNFGYTEHWYWNSPAILKVGFSSEHGLFSWTPILLLGVVGLFFLAKKDRVLATYLLITFAVFTYVMGCYQNWHGLASFGNRFFISLTCFFSLGLAAFFEWLGQEIGKTRAMRAGALATAVLVLWNFGLMFQWGTHLIEARGPISWREAAYNQVAVVPGEAARSLKNYLVHRGRMMQRIEEEDVKQLRSRGD